jgi:vancomycin resistance protein YoaR
MRDYTALHIPAEARSLERARSKYTSRRFRPDKGAELVVAICIFVLFTLCGAVYYCSGLLHSDKFYSNIFIDSVPVGGMTQSEVISKFAALQSSTPRPLSVVIDGSTYSITAEDISAQYNVAETVSAAYEVGRGKQNAFERLGSIMSLRAKPRTFSFTEKYNDEQLRAAAAKIAKSASQPEQSATVKFDPDASAIFAITEGVGGKMVDGDELYNKLKTELATSLPSAVEMKSQAMEPAITAAALKNQTQLVGSFTSALTTDTVRNKNIRLAAAAVNGKVLNPGEELSFNTLTGERTTAKGYVLAPTISNSLLVDAPGGGVCQVSSTIYNAALLAGLEVVERHHHTWPMSYVPPGLDATVDFASSKDLKLKNNSKVPVYLVVKVDEDKKMVTADFYGLPSTETISIVSEDYKVIMPPKQIENGNPNKNIGWSNVVVQAREGCTVSIFRVFTSGTTTRRELVSEDYYPAQQGKIEIGTKTVSNHEK